MAVLIERVRLEREKMIGEEQCRFRISRECMDQVFAVRQVCEKYQGKGKEGHWAFMDTAKVYDKSQ